MANFPSREPEIARLAQDIVNGLAANPDLYPAPPAGPEKIEEALIRFNTAREVAVAAAASAVQTTAVKDEALGALVELLKSDLKYAEAIARNDDGKLQLLGWGARRPRSPSDHQPPGQVITLQVVSEGNDWVTLGWKTPFDGGDVAAYKVQRRKRDGGNWADVGTAVGHEITLPGQENGVEFEYRVIAVNKSGEGAVSNVARAVL
jgi:hypothetical protein